MNSSPIKILLADDDDAHAFVLRTLLEDHGFVVICASSEAEIRQSAEEVTLWVIDVRLPTNSYEGILAVFSLAREGVRSNVPILFISIDTEGMARSHLEGLQQLGIQYKWIMKPFEMQFFLEQVQSILAGYESTQ